MKTGRGTSLKRIAAIILIAWFVGKCSSCLLMLPGPWGPEVRGQLPSGGYLVFQSRPRGRETDDRLTWISGKGETKHFWVDQIHAGFERVVLKRKEDGTGVWVESDGKVGGSLDLGTGEFRAELDPQFPWAQYGTGKKIAEGRTWSFLQVLCPL